MRKRIVLHITTTAETLYGYMSTRIGKEKILNPDGYRAIVDVCDSPEECANEVRRRFGLYIESYLKSDKVVHGFTLIQKDMEIFYKETNLKLNSMQNELSGVLKDDNVTTLSVPFMFNLPLEAFTFGLHVLSLRFAPVLAVCEWFLGKDQKKRDAIDKEYENCRVTVRTTVRVQLEINAGTVLENLIVKVTEDDFRR